MCFFEWLRNKHTDKHTDPPPVRSEETHSETIARHLDEVAALKRRHCAEQRAIGDRAFIEHRLSGECRRSHEEYREKDILALQK